MMDVAKDTFKHMKDNNMNVKIDAHKNNRCTVHAVALNLNAKDDAFFDIRNAPSNK